jgi:hypothetical protein
MSGVVFSLKVSGPS